MLATAIPILLLVFVLQRASTTPLIVLGLALVGFIAISRTYGKLATEMSMQNQNSLEFNSLFGKVSIPISSIKYIDARPWNRGMISIKSSDSYVYFYRNMPGALEAMRELVAINSSIQLKQ